ncbi:hypothetical protein L208DRAFT_1378540 [Tricholoma matsutake]|nr:hypothetical protein L208DRAFT_1378540 [Tricholoma matsutake 945]
MKAPWFPATQLILCKGGSIPYHAKCKVENDSIPLHQQWFPIAPLAALLPEEEKSEQPDRDSEDETEDTDLSGEPPVLAGLLNGSGQTVVYPWTRTGSAFGNRPVPPAALAEYVPLPMLPCIWNDRKVHQLEESTWGGLNLWVTCRLRSLINAKVP